MAVDKLTDEERTGLVIAFGAIGVLLVAIGLFYYQPDVNRYKFGYC